MCFNCDTLNVLIFLNGKCIPVVSHDRHLGDFISTDILDRNMIDYVSDFYERCNCVMSDFRACDSITIYIHMIASYGT